MKVQPFTSQRNQLNILGWGLETEPFVPIVATLSGGSGAVPEPGTIALFAIGAVSLAMLRRRRSSRA